MSRFPNPALVVPREEWERIVSRAPFVVDTSSGFTFYKIPYIDYPLLWSHRESDWGLYPDIQTFYEKIRRERDSYRTRAAMLAHSMFLRHAREVTGQVYGKRRRR